jgi:DNA polymerase I
VILNPASVGSLAEAPPCGDIRLVEQLPFREIVVCDFEFNGGKGLRHVPENDREGNVPNVVCGVFWELRSGKKTHLWQDQFGATPPLVAYMSSAEWGCFLSLGGPLPSRILDLYCEFKNQTNSTGIKQRKKTKIKGSWLRPHGSGLLGADATYGVTDGVAKSDKDHWRDLVIGGGAPMVRNRKGIVFYCDGDVGVTAGLLPHLLADIYRTGRLAFGQALLRGRYMATSARIERTIPFDVPLFRRIRKHRTEIKDTLLAELDAVYNVYEGYSISREKLAAYLIRENLRWPTIDDDPNGKLDLEDDTFRDMAKTYPQIKPLHDLQTIMSVLKLFELTVGRDGRNRTVLWPFQSYTGRNQPSNSKFVFGPDRSFRSLIRPAKGHGVAYLDYKSQEFFVAAVLSGDRQMIEDYLHDDPYLILGRNAGMIPKTGTKETHGAERDLCKIYVLATLYGQGEYGLAIQLNIAPIVARDLQRTFWRRYPTCAAWRDDYVWTATRRGFVETVFGWRARVSPEFNARSIQNFPCQANSAEMLRLACCLGAEAGVDIAAPVHDAVLISAPVDRLDIDIAKMVAAMEEASSLVLGGYTAIVEVDKIVRYPNRYVDKRDVSKFFGMLKPQPPNFLACCSNRTRVQQVPISICLPLTPETHSELTFSTTPPCRPHDTLPHPGNQACARRPGSHTAPAKKSNRYPSPIPVDSAGLHRRDFPRGADHVGFADAAYGGGNPLFPHDGRGKKSLSVANDIPAHRVAARCGFPNPGGSFDICHSPDSIRQAER